MDDDKKISAVVLVNGEDVLLMTEPEKLPAHHAPYRVVGTLHSLDGQLSVSPVETDRDTNMLILGSVINAFQAHVEQVKAKRSHPDVVVLERLVALPDPRTDQ